MAGHRMPQYHLILAGRPQVGKTTIFRYLKGARADLTDHNLTGKGPHRYGNPGWDKWTHYATCNGTRVQVTLWDTAEMEKQGINSMTESYFRRTIGVILIYDAKDMNSLLQLQDWIYRAKESTYRDKLVFSLWRNRDVGTESGMGPVSEEAGKEFAQKHGLPLDLLCEVSTKDRVCVGVEESFSKVINKVHGSCTADSRGNPPVATAAESGTPANDGSQNAAASLLAENINLQEPAPAPERRSCGC